MGAFNDPEVVELLVRVGECDERGRLGSEAVDVAHLQKLNEVFARVNNVRFADVFPKGETKVEAIKQGMYRARVHASAERIVKKENE
jgi:hypothetical protein